MSIHPSRGVPIGVDVEVEPFGPTRPGPPNGPRVDLMSEEGAYVEFDLPDGSIDTSLEVGPRNTARIPTFDPLPIHDLDPKFVMVRRWWNLWYYWRE